MLRCRRTDARKFLGDPTHDEVSLARSRRLHSSRFADGPRVIGSSATRGVGIASAYRLLMNSTSVPAHVPTSWRRGLRAAKPWAVVGEDRVRESLGRGHRGGSQSDPGPPHSGRWGPHLLARGAPDCEIPSFKLSHVVQQEIRERKEVDLVRAPRRPRWDRSAWRGHGMRCSRPLLNRSCPSCALGERGIWGGGAGLRT